MNQTWTIRKASKNDKAQAVPLLCTLMSQHSKYDPYYEPSETLYESFKEEFFRTVDSSDALALVAVNNEAVLGILTLEILHKPSFFKRETYGYVIAGVTDSNHREQGVMNSLYAKGIEWFRNKSVTYVELDIHVMNPESKNFASENGFKKYKEFFRKEL